MRKPVEIAENHEDSESSPSFAPKHNKAFTIQNPKSFNLKFEDDHGSLSMNSKHISENNEKDLKSLESRKSFNNILKLSLNVKIEKRMFSEDTLLVKNIRFREENEFIDSNNCIICEISFTMLKNKLFCKVCGNSVCPSCCSHKVFRDKVLGYRACDLCFIKLLSKEQEKAWKDYFSQKDSKILALNSSLKALNEQDRHLEAQIREAQTQHKKGRVSQDDKIHEVEVQLLQENDFFMKRMENFKRNQATLKTEREILKDLDIQKEKLKSKLAMLLIDISQKSQKLS